MPGQPPPRLVRAAALVAAAEAVALLVLAGYELVRAVTGTPTNPGFAVVNALLTAAVAAALGWLAAALARQRRWARTPLVVLQLLALPVGYTLAFQSGQPRYGTPVLLIAAAELYLLFTPEARAMFDRR